MHASQRRGLSTAPGGVMGGGYGVFEGAFSEDLGLGDGVVAWEEGVEEGVVGFVEGQVEGVEC